jgi:histidinol-phosphate aminotransferase
VSVRNHVREAVRAHDAYTIHEAEGRNLMDNSSRFGPNPAAEEVLEATDAADLEGYPPIDSRPLRTTAAEVHGLDPDQVLTANGANELIDILLRTILEPGDAVAYHSPSFSMIPPFVDYNGGTPAPAPLGDGWTLDAEGMVETDPAMAIVTRPNNPTGNAFAREDVLRAVEGVDGPVVVDEAYVQFGPGSLLDALEDHENMVVLRTLSKAHGLAGLRVGYALAHPALVEEAGKVRSPYRLDAFSERAAVAALRDPTYAEEAAAAVAKQRPRLVDGAERLGVTAFPSDANFVLLEPPVDAHALTEALKDRGILVRDFPGDMAPYLRVTVGPPDDVDAFLEALEPALEEVEAST